MRGKRDRKNEGSVRRKEKNEEGGLRTEEVDEDKRQKGKREKTN